MSATPLRPEAGPDRPLRRKARRRLTRQQRLVRNFTIASGAITFLATLLFLTFMDGGTRIVPPPVAESTNRVTVEAPGVLSPGAADERPVFNHSVVRGGVRSPEEVADAMRRDAVVAAHYAGVNTAIMRVVQLSAPMSVHVSYRIGDAVYWTRKPLTLAAGESVLTDGAMTIRARCGNRLSVEPLAPQLDLVGEPAPPEFDVVVESFRPSGLSVTLPPVPPLPEPPAPTPTPKTASVPDPGPPPVGRLAETPLPVPEPGTSTLVGIGLAAGLWNYLRRSRSAK